MGDCAWKSNLSRAAFLWAGEGTEWSMSIRQVADPAKPPLGATPRSDLLQLPPYLLFFPGWAASPVGGKGVYGEVSDQPGGQTVPSPTPTQTTGTQGSGRPSWHPPHPHSALSHSLLGDRRGGGGTCEQLKMSKKMWCHLGLRKGRHNPSAPGKGFLRRPFCGGSGVARMTGKRHVGGRSSRLRPGCKGWGTRSERSSEAPAVSDPRQPHPQLWSLSPALPKASPRSRALATGCPAS